MNSAVAPTDQTSPHARDEGRVTICIVTHRRPIGLGRLLDSLGKLDSTGDAPSIDILVIDNDADGSARPVCEAHRNRSPHPLHYFIEPRRGIPFARNTAVERAMSLAGRWIAFIDDDEIPKPGWLDALLRTALQFKADIVAGPVVSRFESPPPQWIVRGGFFHRPRRTTGTRMDRAFTGNVLIAREVLLRETLRFDHRMGLSGGSDSLFFQRANRLGFRIIWADQAVVVEEVPSSRANAGWILRRGCRIGAALAFIRRELSGGWRSRVVTPVLIVGYFLLGLLMMPTGLLGKHRIMRSGWYMAVSAGMLLGLMGSQYPEYRRTHGA